MLKNMKLVSRLYFLLFIVLCIAVTLGMIGFAQTTRMSATLDDIHYKGMAGGLLLSEASTAAWELHLGISDYAEANADQRRKIRDGQSALHARLDDNIKKYTALTADPGNDDLLREFTAAYENFKTAGASCIEQVDAGKMQEAAALSTGTVNSAAEAMQRGIRALRDRRQKVNEEIEKGTLGDTTRMHTTLAVLGIIGFFVMFFNIRYFGVSIRNPMDGLRLGMIDVSKTGDFTRRIPVDNNNEIGQAIKAYNQLIANLQDSLRALLGIVEQLTEAAKTSSGSATQLASSSLQQSEATAAIAATMEQVTVSVNHVSANAKTALETSHRSGELCTQGGKIINDAASGIMQIADTVRQTSAAIEALGQQSNQIFSVVRVIKEVADQTNLLALNAAIEAARAGEQGRGFAVVADEVRKLAERTSKATEEIAQMIGTLQERAGEAVNSMGKAVSQVDSGVALAHQAGSAIRQIEAEAEKVISAVSDISSTLVQQSTASESIATHVENVARMTESNSAAANETAKVAAVLQNLANVMRETVNRFKV